MDRNVLERFTDLFREDAALCSQLGGSIAEEPGMTRMFYRGSESGGAVTYPFPEMEALKAMYDAAQPAVCDLGQANVPDPSYQSARTLQRDRFSINLRPDHALLSSIQRLMMPKAEDRDFVRAELDHVSIYGPGDFFKEHQDTPQASCADRFGSLVLCLPTHFEGGALVARNPQGLVTEYDWSTALAQRQDERPGSPDEALPVPKKTKLAATSNVAKASEAVDAAAGVRVEYAVLASDVAHWVLPVTSGYRVTVTFHLYRAALAKEAQMPALELRQRQEVQAVHALLQSQELRGRKVAFPLVHQYSGRIDKEVELKGADAELFRMLQHLETNPAVIFFYDIESEEDFEGCKQRPPAPVAVGRHRLQSKMCYLTASTQLVAGYDPTYSENSRRDWLSRVAKVHHVIWAGSTPATGQALTAAVAYGNEFSLETYTGNVCIVAKF